MSWQCLRCGGVDGHHGWCPEGPLIPCVPGPTEKELAYIAKDELDRLRAVAEAAEKLYALHDGDLEVDDLQKSQEHMDAEEALFDLLDVYRAAKEEEKNGK